MKLPLFLTLSYGSAGTGTEEKVQTEQEQAMLNLLSGANRLRF